MAPKRLPKNLPKSQLSIELPPRRRTRQAHRGRHLQLREEEPRAAQRLHKGEGLREGGFGFV